MYWSTLLIWAFISVCVHIITLFVLAHNYIFIRYVCMYVNRIMSADENTANLTKGKHWDKVARACVCVRVFVCVRSCVRSCDVCVCVCVCVCCVCVSARMLCMLCCACAPARARACVCVCVCGASFLLHVHTFVIWVLWTCMYLVMPVYILSLIHISEPTRPP